MTGTGRGAASLRCFHMRRILATAALLAALSPAACANGKPGSTPAPSAVPATQSLGRADDPSGQTACQQIARVDTDTVTNYKVMLPIIQAAAQSTTPAIVTAGAALGDKYRLAILSKGTDDEVSTKIEAFTAATELRTACITAGLDS